MPGCRVAALTTTDKADRSELNSQVPSMVLEVKGVHLLVEYMELPQGKERLYVIEYVAHELAQVARRNTHAATWWGTSVCVLDLINSDCNTAPN